MHIAEFSITGYRCFQDQTDISFGPGLNIVVGQNNVGKTTLIDLLTLDSSLDGDRGVRERGRAPLTSVRVTMSGREALEALMDGESCSLLPRHMVCRMLGITEGLRPSGNVVSIDWAKDLGTFDEIDDLTFTLESRQGQWWRLRDASRDKGGISWLAGDDEVEVCGRRVREVPPEFEPGSAERSTPERIGSSIHAFVRSRIYRVGSERRGADPCMVGTGQTLLPDAANLPEVLSNLQGMAPDMAEYNELVHRVLPQIGRVAVRNLPNHQCEVVIQTDGDGTTRPGAGIPLSRSGTGVAQVLAMLYVVFANKAPGVLLIDEPQSFLHPGAIRKLLGTMCDYPQHQYVITTHSPEVIAFAKQGSLISITSNGRGSTVQNLSPSDKKDALYALQDLGVRLSDVFGADKVLWVEGQTEEICFPMVLAKCAPAGSRVGLAVVAVSSTDELLGSKKTRPEMVFRVYERLTKGAALIPPAIGFVFDPETRPPDDLKTLERSCLRGAKLRFLKRRMYENYLLDEDAIWAVIIRISEDIDAEDGWTCGVASKEHVAGLIANRRQHRKHCPPGTTDSVWHIQVDGAKLLCDIFREAFGPRVAYSKTEHSVALTEWLLANKPDTLSDVAALLQEMVCTEATSNSML